MRRRVVTGVAALALLFSLSVMSVGAGTEDEALCKADIETLFDEEAGCLDNGCEADTGVCGKASSGGSCWCLY